MRFLDPGVEFECTISTDQQIICEPTDFRFATALLGFGAALAAVLALSLSGAAVLRGAVLGFLPLLFLLSLGGAAVLRCAVVGSLRLLSLLSFFLLLWILEAV